MKDLATLMGDSCSSCLLLIITIIINGRLLFLFLFKLAASLRGISNQHFHRYCYIVNLYYAPLY